MAHVHKLLSDQDFTEAMDKQARLRVFRDDHVIDTDGVIVRFDDQTVVVQSSVSDVAYHSRKECEFFEMKRR
ncbi:hypothetical protein FHS18_004408 [Paenibacillus phyllosphaerae]|uniref:Uncharacterized protein n=1 Tax=Paenibacillus phyllosphaerae TaxID=274593 RepID=A0A7W5B137_9BACL|nr:hypothetical protein [Paenibacillus phyllosphaerae]MBB3112322.1 hypothetical protein [Paenibacillus phyllosphaerae]